MGIIKLDDIDLSKLEKTKIQGTKSTIYKQDDVCIKILDKLYPEEKQKLYRKLLEMDGIRLNNAILPIDLIVNNGSLEGYTMEYFKDSINILDYFFRNRFVNCKDIFDVVKRASIILREIHSSGIICQDLSFENILIDINGNIKYSDLDGCCYKEYMSPFISYLLKYFLIDYRKEQYIIPSENLDRISFMLSFFAAVYFKEIQNLSKKKYNELSSKIRTLENVKTYANMLVNKDLKLPIVPYLDELIDSFDDYIIDRNKQVSFKDKILRRVL